MNAPAPLAQSRADKQVADGDALSAAAQAERDPGAPATPGSNAYNDHLQRVVAETRDAGAKNQELVAGDRERFFNEIGDGGKTSDPLAPKTEPSLTPEAAAEKIGR